MIGQFIGLGTLYSLRAPGARLPNLSFVDRLHAIVTICHPLHDKLALRPLLSHVAGVPVQSRNLVARQLRLLSSLLRLPLSLLLTLHLSLNRALPGSLASA